MGNPKTIQVPDTASQTASIDDNVICELKINKISFSMLTCGAIHARSGFVHFRSFCSKVVMVVGGRRGIGKGFVDTLIERAEESGKEINIVATSSQHSKIPDLQNSPNVKLHTIKIDINDTSTYKVASEWVKSEFGRLDMLINCIGVLHGKLRGESDTYMPEKSFSELDPEWMIENYRVNTVPSAMLAKHFCDLLASGSADSHGVFASLSARIGSISDNGLGGWYSYRCSKAALHQYMKTLSIELSRRYKPQKKGEKEQRPVMAVSLHPGTVDTGLSEPFQRNINKNKLFSPHFSTTQLLDVLESLELKQNGKIFAYDGSEIHP